MCAGLTTELGLEIALFLLSMGKILITLMILIALIFMFVFSGLCKVSARKKDPALVDWFLGTVSEHSIE